MGKLTRFILPTMVLTAALSVTSCGQYRGVGMFRDLKTAIPTVGLTTLLAMGVMTLSDMPWKDNDDDKKNKHNDDDWTRQ